MCTAVLPAGKWVIASLLHNGRCLCLTWFFSWRTSKGRDRKEWKPLPAPTPPPSRSQKFFVISSLCLLLRCRNLQSERWKTATRLWLWPLCPIALAARQVSGAMLIRKVLLVLLVWWLIQFDIQIYLSGIRVWCFSSCSGLMTLICEHTAWLRDVWQINFIKIKAQLNISSS